MKRQLSAFIAGVIFAVGLGLAGLLQPARVIGFVDFLGVWDPSAAFAMASAVIFGMVLFRLVLKRTHPIFDAKFHLPQKKEITPSLVIGATIFGLGWGLSGYCPGPAITSSILGNGHVLIILAAMIAGMLGVKIVKNS